MKTTMMGATVVLAGGLLLGANASALSPAVKCEASKLKASEGLSSCQLAADVQAVKTGGTADLSNCDAQFATAWATAETNGKGRCLTNGDEAAVQAFITQCTDDVAAALAGGALPHCTSDLATCNTSLATCNGSLNTCGSNLSAAQASLTSCSGNLATTQASLATCNSNLATCDSSLSSCNASLAVAQTCGNGVIDPGEQCDQSNLNGQTCASQGFAAGVLKCGAGCMFDTSGCSASRLVDNGDGTVSDLQTGLMWEKKTYGQCVNLVNGSPIACISDADCTGNLGGGRCVCPYEPFGVCPHFVGATYTWNNPGNTPICSGIGVYNDSTLPNGTAFTDFLATLNGGVGFVSGAYSPCIFDGTNPPYGGFAGHCDWRLPTLDELRTIVDSTQGVCGGGSGACIDPVFGPMQPDQYWSGTSWFLEDRAWSLSFAQPQNQAPVQQCKNAALYARAVRGGP